MTMKLKRSSVPSKVPTNADLQLGQLAMNTNDGKLFMKKSVSGVESVVAIGGAEPKAGDVVFGTSAPSNGTWLEAGKYYSKSSYPVLAAALGNIPDIGDADFSGTMVNIPNLVSSSSNAPQDISTSRYAMAYGNGVYVYLASNSVFYSTDGVTWERPQFQAISTLRFVKFINGQFIAGGAGIYTSTDGITWTTSGIGVQRAIYDITFNAGMYVAAADVVIYYSSDLVTWGTYVSPDAVNGVNYFATYSLGKFIVVGQNGVFTSSNGVSWVRAFSTSVTRWATDGTYFAVITTSGADIYYTTDFSTWLLRANGGSATSRDIGYANGKWVCLINTSGAIQITYSTNIGTTAFSAATLPNGGLGVGTAPYAFTYNSTTGMYFVAVTSRSNYFYSTDAVTWFSAPSVASQSIIGVMNGVTYVYGGNKVLCRVVGSPPTETVVDSFAVTEPPSHVFAAAIRDQRLVAYNPGSGTYIAVPSNNTGTANGILLRSSNGVDWTPINIARTGTLVAGGITQIYYESGHFIAVSNLSGQLWYSNDNGNTWFSSTYGSAAFTSLKFLNGNFLLCNGSSTIYTGANLASLTPRTLSGTVNNTTFNSGSGYYYAFGTSVLSYSTDAVTWTSISTLYTINDLEFNPATNIGVGAASTQILRISGNTTVTADVFPGAAMRCVRVTSSGTWVVGGASGNLYYSSNGTTWISIKALYDYNDTTTSYSYFYNVGSSVVAMTDNSAFVVISADGGLTWTRYAGRSNTASSTYSCANNILYRFTSGNEMSVDGKTWAFFDTNIISKGQDTNIQQLTQVGDRVFLMGQHGMSSSTDGVNFQFCGGMASVAANSFIIYDGTRYVLCSAPGSSNSRPTTFSTSTDGVTFTFAGNIANKLYSGASPAVTGFEYVNGRYVVSFASVIVGYTTAVVYTSTDLVTWTSALAPYSFGSTPVGGLASDGVKAVLALFGQIAKSTDGVTFTPSALTLTNQNVIYHSGVWYTINLTSGPQVSWSDDGENWVVVPQFMAGNTFHVYTINSTYSIIRSQTSIYVLNRKTNTVLGMPIPLTNTAPFTPNTTPIATRGPIIGTTLLTHSTPARPVIGRIPMYSYDTATTFWVPPITGSAVGNGYVCAGA